MNKKLTALAVAGALAAPAVVFAQASNVNIYGRLNLGLDNYSATGATNGAAFDYKSRNRIYDAGSRLGFSGSEDLGGGLKALFLIESGTNIDTGGTTGQSGSPNPYTGTLSSRIGYVGLQGNWGRLTFGKDNVWWANYPIEQTGANYVATGLSNFYGLFGRGMGVGVTRVSNLVQYAAQAGGITGIVSYAPQGESVGPNANANGRLFGVTVQGQWGAIGAGYDWVNLKGNSPATGGQPASTGNKFRIGYTYQPGSMVSLLWVKSTQDNGGSSIIGLAPVLGANTATAVTLMGVLPDPTATSLSLSQSSWGLSWEHMFGNIQALAQWAKVNNITGCTTPGACDHTGATTWMVGLRYNVSKRTGLYINYATIRNDSNYNMDFVGGWMTSAATTLPAAFGGANVAPGLPSGSVGADPRLFGVGIMHNF